MTAPDRTIHVVVLRGRYYAERKDCETDLKSTIVDIVAGQITEAVSVYAFNPVEGWSRDVSEDVARACARRWSEEYPGEKMPDDLRGFIERHCGVGTVIPAAA